MNRRTASTSTLAYRELHDAVLAPRERAVLSGLEAFMRAYGTSPTSLELLEFLRPRDPVFTDSNALRPRLSALRDVGLVVGDEKRRCAVSGRLAWTWMPTATTTHMTATPASAAPLPSAPSVAPQQPTFDLGAGSSWGPRS